MAEKSNITLTSLVDLASTVGDQYVAARVANLHIRIHNVLTKLRALRRLRYDDEFYPPTMEAIGKVIYLPVCIDEAVQGKFPVPYTSFGPDQKFAHSVDEMLNAADGLVFEAEAWTPLD